MIGSRVTGVSWDDGSFGQDRREALMRRCMIISALKHWERSWVWTLMEPRRLRGSEFCLILHFGARDEAQPLDEIQLSQA